MQRAFSPYGIYGIVEEENLNANVVAGSTMSIWILIVYLDATEYAYKAIG